MPDCQCDRLERTFNDKVARTDLRDYLRGGPDRSTAMLVERLAEDDVTGRSLLDVGGGIGAVQFELFARGLASSVDVDASAAYLSVAREEAAKRGFGDRTQYRQGDFVAMADDLGVADLVSLDRVICCYPDLEALAGKAAQRTRIRLGVVHPHDRWWARAGVRVMNLVGRPFGVPRFFVHRTRRFEEVLRSAGLEREWAGGTRFWRVATYRRVADFSG